MDALIEWLWDISYWHWWALALVLVAIEVTTPTTYLLWPAISAAVVGLAVALLGPFDWRLQVLVFAVLALLTSVVWARTMRRRGAPAADETLNSRGRSYVGRRLHLARPLPDGRGQIQLDDTWWPARSADGSTLGAGDVVEVVASDGALLVVRPVPPSPQA